MKRLHQNSLKRIVETNWSAQGEVAPFTLSPGTIVGGYTLLRTIGVGGLGVVYEARHQRLDKPVAVKALRSSLLADPDARERFLREGRTAAKLRHPNIVDVSDVTVDSDTPYLVMELLQGEDLASLLAREGSLGAERTVDLLVPIISALTLAHENGVVHRDLKPQNIFLNHTSFGTVPKVVDFGISKVVGGRSADLTHSNACVGTPHYMSPEQAHAQSVVDHRSDQFSLGVMAYECLTGRRPFTGDSVFLVLNSVISHHPPPAHKIKPGVEPMLSAIIMKMMAKDPAARFDDMQSVGQLLLPFASFRMKVAYAAEFSSGALTRSRAEVALHTLRSAPLLMGAGRVRKSLKYSVMAILVASGLVGLAFRSWKHNVARPMSAVASNSGKAFASSVDTVLAASVVGSQPTANDEQVSAGKRSTSATLDGTPLVRAQPKKPVPREDHVSSVRSPTATAQSAAIVAPSLDEVAPPKRGVNGALILP